MEIKPGMKSTEWIALVASIVLAVVPVLLDKVPAESTLYVILGLLVTVATYIVGRSHVKASGLKAEAMAAAVKASAGPQ